MGQSQTARGWRLSSDGSLSYNGWDIMPSTIGFVLAVMESWLQVLAEMECWLPICLESERPSLKD